MSVKVKDVLNVYRKNKLDRTLGLIDHPKQYRFNIFSFMLEFVIFSKIDNDFKNYLFIAGFVAKCLTQFQLQILELETDQCIVMPNLLMFMFIQIVLRLALTLQKP